MIQSICISSVKKELATERRALEVWNPGELPPVLRIEDLGVAHASVPHNPLIAEPMFLATYAEKAGSGILDMIKRCRAAGLRAPAFRQTGGQFVQTLWRPKMANTQPTERATKRPSRPTQSATQSRDPVLRLVQTLSTGALSPQALRSALAITHRPTFRANYLQPALKRGLIERTLPGKPSSRLQEYRLTEKGRAWLAAR